MLELGGILELQGSHQWSRIRANSEQGGGGTQEALFEASRVQLSQGFPGGTVVKNPPADAGDTGSSPGPGRSHMPRSN